MRLSCKLALASAVVLGALAVHAAPAPQLLVVCSPGSPGTTEEAQPRMDAFAAALSARAGRTITAVYEPTDAGGAKRIDKAALAIVSLPFFLEHEQDLGLHARLQAVQEGRPALEHWVLVAPKGRVKRAGALAGFTIVSSSAFAPGFVRAAVQGLGKLPVSVKLVQSGAVLSSLRRAANGEALAVLLDGPQAAAIGSLPFASKLEVVTSSPAWPAGLVVTVGTRMPAGAWTRVRAALLRLPSDRAGAAALAAIKTARFAPLDEQALASARAAYASAR